MKDWYDVIVIGGGHAGAEAAWAAASALGWHDTARRGWWHDAPRRESSRARDAERRATTERHSTRGRVALITMDPSKIGTMSCNPAIGGLAKGQMVREIDALGGLMGLAIDATGIMFKMLNTSKGAAVRGPRAQADKYAYAAEVQRLLSTRAIIDVIAGTVDDIVMEDGRVVGVMLSGGARVVRADPEAIAHNLAGEKLAKPIYPRLADLEVQSSSPRPLRAPAVVLTTGTFMRGLMHTGEQKSAGGRVGEGAATGISGALRRLGFELGRLKTGTPPRLARQSIDWDSLTLQIGDAAPVPFSDMTLAHGGGAKLGDDRAGDGLARGSGPARPFPLLPQIECRMTATTAAMHELIRANLHRAPMYSGQIEADCGPRYCPSIEDKVVRFAERDSHHVYLEPESLHTNEIYCNGISTSLPVDVQEQLVRAMPGCERATVLRWGYAVEYDMIWPHQIDSTCMAKSIAGLFPAGQINGTSGYEEAGGQGLVAGLNAARFAQGEDLVRLGRDQAYIGVMMDDLVTKTPREPYRMFTSRAEHRLLLRAENSDERLTPLGRALGIVDDQRWGVYELRRAALGTIRRTFDSRIIDGRTLREIARRPESSVDQIVAILDGSSAERTLVERAVTEARYEGYIARQRAEVKRQAAAEQQSIPAWLDFALVPGLRAEAVEVLQKFHPATMGQAGRLAGVNPADLTLIAVALRRGRQAVAAPAIS